MTEDPEFDRRKTATNPEFGPLKSGQGGEPKPPIQSRQATGFSPNRWVLYFGVLGTVVGFVLIYVFFLGTRT